MVCPKCGAKVEDTATVCEYCNEKLEPVAQVEEGQAAPAKEAKFDFKKIDLKDKKTLIKLGAAVVALALVIVLVCALVNGLKNPVNTAEKYVEACLDGDLKDALKVSAPWVIRDLAVELEMKETDNARKVAKEYEEYEEFEKAEGKAKIVRSEVLGWTDNKDNNASYEVFGISSGMKFSEAKNIKEYAKVRVYYTLTQKGGEPVDHSWTVNLAKVGGNWYVLNEIDD